MKKTIVSLFAIIACVSVNAQNLKIYKGNSLVAEYSAEQADNVVFSKENGEQPAAKRIVMDKCIGESDGEETSYTYYATSGDGTLVTVTSLGQFSTIAAYAYNDHQIQKLAFDDDKCIYTLNDQNLITKNEIITQAGKTSTTKYEYDSKGRLISVEGVESNTLTTYTWNDDDDVVKYVSGPTDGDPSSTTIITPSDQSIDHEFTLNNFTSADNNLFMKGYFGKSPKHLPAHVETNAEGGPYTLSLITDYKYTITNGRLVEMDKHTETKSSFELLNSEDSTKYKFFWRELKD